MDFSAPRKSRLSALQLQAQLSRLSDRTKLRRPKNTLLSKRARQQAARIEDLCHTHVSHKWLCHSHACAGSVLTPHDNITNVQKRLGNRTWTGFGQCWLCGSFPGPTAGTWRNVQHRRSHSGTLRMRPRFLRWTKKRTRESPQNPEDSQKRNPGRLISLLPLLSQDAPRLWMCVWPPPTQQQLKETLRMKPLIVNYHTTDNRYLIFVVRAFFTVPL